MNSPYELMPSFFMKDLKSNKGCLILAYMKQTLSIPNISGKRENWRESFTLDPVNDEGSASFHALNS